MPDRRQWIVVVAVAGLAVSVVMIALGIPARSRMLAETGETQRSVQSSMNAVIPARASSATDPTLLSGAEALKQEKYVAWVWVTDPSGEIVFHSGGPGSSGENVENLARRDASLLLESLPKGILDPTQRLLLMTARALRSEGEHNDVLRHAVRPVFDQSGKLAAVVGIAYDVNPAISSPGLWWNASILVALGGLAVYWLGLPAWVYLDARSQRDVAVLWGAFVLITNLVGLMAYLIATAGPRGSRA
jgi:hypothetical protein